MVRFFKSIIDVRRGEVALTLLMFFYYYLLLVTYYFLKPARDSLFLIRLGAEQLPFVFILIAVIVVPVTTAYSRASGSLKLNRLINATTLILIVNLFILRWLLGLTQPWVFYLFYVWVSIYGVLTTSQFWLLANAMFDAAQAKRIFVLFGLGGIVGAFTGGEVTSFITEAFGVTTENLLFFCVAFLGICVFLVNAVWTLKQRGDSGAGTPSRPRARQKEQKKESVQEIFKMIKRSRHLMLIVGILGMTVATATFVDYQFKTVAVGAFPVQQDLTSFFGKFYGRLSLVAFMFQLLFSYRVLRTLGVGGVILFLPLGLLGGSVMMLAYPGLVAGILIRGADGVFRYSIDKTGRELLFLPVPLDVKKRTKVFIDMFIDRWSRGIAGLALLLLVSVIGLSVRQLSVFVIVMLAVWIGMVVLVRKEYINAFRRALERRQIDPGELRINIAEPSTLKTLGGAIASGNPHQIVHALDMLSGVKDHSIVDMVRPLLEHESADIRLRAANVLRGQDGDFSADMRALVTDSDPRVQRGAMRYVCANSQSGVAGTLESYLNDPDPRVRAVALSCAAEFGGSEARRLVSDSAIRDLLSSGDEHARVQVAAALGEMDNPEYRKIIYELMEDPSPAVAVEAITSAGRTGVREFVPKLIGLLSDKRFRKPAADALTAYGDRVVGTLGDHITDASVPLPIRSRMCRILSKIPSQHSVDSLVSALETAEIAIKYYVIKALNSLRARYPELQFEHDTLDTALIEETKSYYTILQILYLDGFPDSRPGHLLVKTLEEKIDQNLERIFRLLGLRYPAKDIYTAYLGIVSTRKDLRSSAVEFLDNILKKNLKKYLFPIVDNIADDTRVKKGRELFGVSFENRDAALEHLIESKDPWLRACAVYCVNEDSPPKLQRLAGQCLNDPDPLVRETATLVARSGSA